MSARFPSNPRQGLAGCQAGYIYRRKHFGYFRFPGPSVCGYPLVERISHLGRHCFSDRMLHIGAAGPEKETDLRLFREFLQMICGPFKGSATKKVLSFHVGGC
jgi:hypothetical protein